MYKYVDGYNGNYVGNHVMSPIKTFAVSSIIGALIPVIPLILTPHFTIASLGATAVKTILSRMLVGGLITGLPSALFAKLKNEYIKTHNEPSKEDMEKNGTYQASDEDIERKTKTEELNRLNGGSTEWFSDEDRYKYYDTDTNTKNQNINQDIREKLILLNLNPNKIPTLDELKL